MNTKPRFSFFAKYFNCSVIVVFSVLTIFFFPACKHTKEIVKEQPSEASVPAVKTPQKQTNNYDANAMALLKFTQNNSIQFNELVAKMKTKVSSPSLNQSFTTNIRWKKGEKIWLSMSIIGIEGARVLITKDSIKIMDKINNRYILKPLSYIKQKTLVDLSFSDIENLLLGQPVFTDSAKAKYTSNATNIIIYSDGIRFLTNLLFDKITKYPTSLMVNDKIYSQTIETTYSNYETQLGKPFAMDRLLKMKNSLEVFEMTVKFQNIEARQNLDYPFTVNPNYTIEK